MADKEAQRPGFTLCRHCGKVQKPGRRGAQAEQTHSFDCPKHGSDDPASLLDCLYLYREFESEALRILVPYTKNGVDDRVVQSFMAAVQLGLKRRFGGKVDHLRMVLQDEPGKDGGPRRHYVMLYDSVPGGTGYLHQLLAHDAKTLSDVLRMSLEALTSCSCDADPEKDGCYRCLYQYRLGRSMELVSRDTAKAVLTELVQALPSLERVKTISDIYINPNFDSVLEARFIESLKKMSGVGGLPTVKLVQDVINGKSGYVLELAGQRYRIEPQCSLNADQGISVPSLPDFVIWPWASGSNRRPVAVFCDGWAYHKDCMRDDALKRSAIVASGRFWTWSVTHQDVTAAIDGNSESDLDPATVVLSRHDGTKAPSEAPRAQEKAFTQNAVARLLHWLSTPVGGTETDSAVDSQQRNASWLELLMVPATSEDHALAEAQRGNWLPHLPLHVREPGPGFAPVTSRSLESGGVLGWWPMALAKGLPKASERSAPGVVMLDDSGATDDESLHRSWRRWLQLFNTMQFLPGIWLVTASGLSNRDYDGLTLGSNGPTGESAVQMAFGGAWQAVIDEALDALASGLKALAQAGGEPPAVGLELADAKGRVVADCELAWPASKLALLRPDQEDLLSVWAGEGWRALLLSDDGLYIAGEAWQWVAAAALGLTLKTD